jgi:uncharacterized protein YlzI (FlbEa/FlbD family)
MAFLKTTLTDELTGKNSEFCFNTNYVMSMQPARHATVLTFVDGQKMVVDTHYEALLRFVVAAEKLESAKS